MYVILVILVILGQMFEILSVNMILINFYTPFKHSIYICFDTINHELLLLQDTHFEDLKRRPEACVDTPVFSLLVQPQLNPIILLVCRFHG